MRSILMATNNPGKLKEIHAILSDLSREFPGAVWLGDYQLRSPADLGIDLDVVEDGDTYASNAAKKVSAFREACLAQLNRQVVTWEGKTIQGALPFVVLADDSGLEVNALDGAPGIHSARFAPEGEEAAKGRAGDAGRRHFLLEALSAYPQPWTARFHCTIAIAPLGSDDVLFAEGNCPGEIIPDERGYGGFGYDPIFLLPEKGMTMAELPMEDKNRLSHRARALYAALPVLEGLIKA